MIRSVILVLFLLSTTAAFSPFAIPATAVPTNKKMSALFSMTMPTPPHYSGGVGAGGPSIELLELFNHQVTNELESSQLYLSASIWFDSHDFGGMATYMLAESAEERQHALRMIDFANKRHIPIKLEALPAPTADWDNPEQVWQDIFKLEHDNTNNLLLLAEAANQCRDFAVLAFLNPFHIEQVDSEDTIATILAKVHDEARTPGLLRQLDHELGLEAVGRV